MTDTPGAIIVYTAPPLPFQGPLTRECASILQAFDDGVERLQEGLRCWFFQNLARSWYRRA